MAATYESKCPLCETPRAKGQMRCICNYTFEYERESRPFRRVSEPSMALVRWTPAKIAVAGIVILVIAGGAAAFIAL